MAQVVLYGPNGLTLNPQTPMIVDPTHFAARASLRPFEHVYPGFTGGHYLAYGATSALAFSANATLLAFRFAPATNTPLAILTRLRAHVYVAAAVTAQRMDPLVAFFSRSYSVADTTNATALVLSGNNAKVKTAFMSTPIATIGVASAAGGASGGTKTNDANAFGAGPLSGSAAIAGVGTGSVWLDLYKLDDHGKHPIIFGTSGPEGFVVNLGATAIATGTVIAGFEVGWAEALTF